MKINKSIVLITGSTRGIGRAIAIELSKSDYTVVVTGTNEKLLDETVNYINSSDGEAYGIVCNLLKIEAAQKLIDKVIGEFGQLDVLINNAGFAWADSFENVTEDDYEKIMGLNVKAPMFLTKAALPNLLKSSEKAIVNISSVVGHKAYANQTLYAASKHALNGMMSALAKEYRSQKLRVYNVAPGGVATEMIQTARPDLDAKTLIQPEEIAKTVAFLLSLKGKAQIDEVRIRRQDNMPFE